MQNTWPLTPSGEWVAGRRLLKLATPWSSCSLCDWGPGRTGRRPHVPGQQTESHEGAPRQPPACPAASCGLLRQGRGVTLSYTGALWGLVLRPAMGRSFWKDSGHGCQGPLKVLAVKACPPWMPLRGSSHTATSTSPSSPSSPDPPAHSSRPLKTMASSPGERGEAEAAARHPRGDGDSRPGLRPPRPLASPQLLAADILATPLGRVPVTSSSGTRSSNASAQPPGRLRSVGPRDASTTAPTDAVADACGLFRSQEAEAPGPQVASASSV